MVTVLFRVITSCKSTFSPCGVGEFVGTWKAIVLFKDATEGATETEGPTERRGEFEASEEESEEEDGRAIRVVEPVLAAVADAGKGIMSDEYSVRAIFPLLATPQKVAGRRSAMFDGLAARIR